MSGAQAIPGRPTSVEADAARRAEVAQGFRDLAAKIETNRAVPVSRHGARFTYTPLGGVDEVRCIAAGLGLPTEETLYSILVTVQSGAVTYEVQAPKALVLPTYQEQSLPRQVTR